MSGKSAAPRPPHGHAPSRPRVAPPAGGKLKPLAAASSSADAAPAVIAAPPEKAIDPWAPEVESLAKMADEYEEARRKHADAEKWRIFGRPLEKWEEEYLSNENALKFEVTPRRDPTPTLHRDPHPHPNGPPR